MAQYNSMNTNNIWIHILSISFSGIICSFSNQKIRKHGNNKGIQSTYHDIAVCITAFFAAILLLPIITSGLDGSTRSIPFFISVWRMKYALRNPAVEQAKKTEIELYIINSAPYILYVFSDKTFLIDKATVILVTHAIK